MNRGLAALPVKHFQSGGFNVSLSDPATTTAPAIDAFGLFSPVVDVSTPIGVIGVSPASLAAMAVPAISPVVTAINAMNALAAMNAPSPVAAPTSSVEGQIATTVAQEAVDAVDAAEGLAAMNAANAQAQAAESAAQSDAAATAAMADAVADSVAVADAADAAAAAASGADGGVGGGGGDGGGGGGGDGGAGAGVGGSGDASGDGSGGERAGGLIGRKHYQFGGSVMGMGDAAPRYAYAPIMMAEGGLAAAAQQLQNRGRGNDSMLVHMTPGEVKGLQALAMAQGGSLTINPTTGLPEAGILSSLLPMIAGFALGPAGFGLMSAAGAGLTVGALTGIATGSLKKGLMAGLGAYGGAGLGEGLVSAATPATDVVTQAPNLTSAGEMAVSNVTPEAAQALSYGDKVGLGMQSPYFQAAQSNIDPSLLESMTAEQVVNAPVLSATPGVMPPPAPTTTGFGAAQSGFENVFKGGTEGKAARAAFGKALPFGTTMAIGAPLASAAAEPPKGPTPSPAFIRPYKFSSNPIEGAYTPSPRPGDTAERRYFDPTFTPLPIYQAAQGGQVDPDYDMAVGQSSAFSDGYAEGGSTGLGALAKRRKSLRGEPFYKFSQDRRDQSMEAAIEQNFAKGGLGAAGKSLPPRFLSGGGDGMSDSIKANIDGKQEARLADGEFVVPADVVSHLGNGSSKAGAKKLYAMMDKIRKARTGTKRQAPEVNAAKYMPA